jgi:broad-specificity NMP kinase
MNSPVPASPESAAPPASAWVRFLRSYGPTPTNLNLYDEHVTGALGRAKVKPITLSSPLLEKIKERVASGKPGSILIAGTAGDGKTYHCRSLWSFLGGTDKEWSNDSTVKMLTLADGRRAVFVKDLSELSDDQSDQALALMEQTVFGDLDNSIVVVAANHGQILKRLGDLGIREKRVHPLRKHIQDAFLLTGMPMDRLAIFDLSRTTHRSSLEEVLKAVAGHEEWDNCARCTRQGDGSVCPIAENRTRLLGAADGGVFARRLGDLVEVARLNGSHLPVRDMLALVSNMILGHKDKDTKEGLMACSDIARIQDAGTMEKGSLYGNVFGANLPRRRAMDRPVFKALASFGIGEETTNSADGLLVYGNDDAKLAPNFARLVANDPIYGATAAFMALQKQYLEGEDSARLDGGADEFMERLVSQRRRLFFTLPDADSDYGHWGMTAFRFAGDYLAMSAALISKKAMEEATREMLVRGLNRVMTGLLIDNADKIFVASSGGFTQSKVSVLCDTEAPSRREGGVGLIVKHDPQTERPLLDIALAPGAGNSVTFSLTPVRFEFLCRVAEGALPGSFSNECLEDMLAFKAKLLRKAELIRIQRGAEDEEEAGFGDGALTLKFIEIEQNGHGFSRPVTVRVDA